MLLLTNLVLIHWYYRWFRCCPNMPGCGSPRTRRSCTLRSEFKLWATINPVYLTRPLISISSVPWGSMHFLWIPRWGGITRTRETREIILIFRPANSKLAPTPTTSQKWRSNKPIKFKGNSLITWVRYWSSCWLMFQVCQDG